MSKLSSFSTYILTAVAAKLVDVGLEALFRNLLRDAEHVPNPDMNRLFELSKSSTTRAPQEEQQKPVPEALVLEEVALHCCQFTEAFTLLKERYETKQGFVSLDERQIAFHLGAGLKDCLPHLKGLPYNECDRIITDIEDACSSLSPDFARSAYWDLYNRLSSGGGQRHEIRT